MPEVYPIRLIPQSNLTLISSANLNPNHHIGIWVDGSINFRDSDGLLSYDTFEGKKLPGLSNNKIPDSIKEDLSIKFLENFKDLYLLEWKAGNEGVNPDPSHFIRDNNRNYYFLKISSINSWSDKIEKDGNDFCYQLILVHKPLIVNYWHFEFSISNNGQEITYSKSAWKNKIWSAIKAHIIQSAIFEI